MFYLITMGLGILAVEAIENEFKEDISPRLSITWPTGKKVIKKEKPAAHRADALLQAFPPALKDAHVHRHERLYYDTVKEAYDRWIQEKINSWEQKNDEAIEIAREKIEDRLEYAKDNLSSLSYKNVILPLIAYEDLKLWHYMVCALSRSELSDKKAEFLHLMQEKIEEARVDFGFDFYEKLIQDLSYLPTLNQPEDEGRLGTLTPEDLKLIRGKFAHLRDIPKEK